MSFYNPMSQDEAKAEATELMKWAVRYGVLGVVAQIAAGVLLLAERFGGSIALFLLSWVPIGIGAYYKGQAEAIYPDGFKKK